MGRGSYACGRAGSLLIAVALLLIPVVAPVTSAQSGDPAGEIAFVRNGDVWVWTPDGSEAVVESGAAMDASLSPAGDAVAYIESGGSFSNLVIFDRDTERNTRVTDNEPFVESGSPDYVASSSWAIDPSWSASGRLGFISDRDAPDRLMQLWLVEANARNPRIAPGNGQDAGSIEHLELSRDGFSAVYTVLAAGGPEGGTTYVALRDFRAEETYPIAEGVQGAYDPTLSPDGSRVVVSIRDEAGTSDLWIIEIESGMASRLTQGLQATNATWSPDGRSLAYMTPNDQSFTIWAAPINPEQQMLSGEPRKLVDEPGIDATSGLSWID